jgi:ABC-type lipoprotein export system ATPase subunit
MQEPDTKPPVIEAQGLIKTYQRGKEQVEALRGVNMTIPPGAFVVIIGPSGSGKSTLLHLFGGIDKPSAGHVRVQGMALESASENELTLFRRDNIGFIFQFYNLLPSLSALDNVILPLLAQGRGRGRAREIGRNMLEQVGLSHRREHNPAQLSGGEQQRVAIARAMVVEPAVILADEPTGDLDSASAKSVFDLMRDLNQRKGATFIIATHNQQLAKDAGLVYELHDGQIRS